MDLNQWLTRLAAELDVADLAADDLGVDERTRQILLDLARDCAHEVERVAAPLSTFLLGVAVGRGAEVSAAANRATAALLDEPTHTDG